jgi:hypothetical protein
MTDGQSASLSWNKAPIWSLRPDFYYCQTVAGLLMWGALSDEKTGLSITTGAGPRQRSHSRIVSDSRLPFSSPITTRRATVEVFDLASTRDAKLLSVIIARHGPRRRHRSLLYNNLFRGNVPVCEGVIQQRLHIHAC